MRGYQNGDSIPPVAAIDAEIRHVHGDDGVTGVELTEADEAHIREIGVAVGIAFRDFSQPRQLFGNVQGRHHQTFPNQGQRYGGAPKVKGGLCQHSLASQQGFGHLFGQADRPVVVAVAPAGERDQKAREERSGGPETQPAKRMNGFPREARAFSNSSRTIFPWGRPGR